MQLQFPRAHRLARINYPSRTWSFAFSFLIVLAILAERGFSAGTFIFSAAALLIYPHLAYLHARIAVDSKRAEFRNLVFDAVLMGLLAAQLHFALWPVCGALLGVSMNNAVCGGIGRFLSGLLYFAVAAVLWAVVGGVTVEPSTGALVTGLCFFGIVGYGGWLAVFVHDQNSRLVRTRDVLRMSDEQFRFIASHAGDLVAVLTPAYRFRYASLSHEYYFESTQFADGADWLEVVHPEDRARARAFLDLLSTSKQNQRAQLRMMSAGAPPRLFECEGNPVREEGDKLQMIVLLSRDLIVSDGLKAAGLGTVLAAKSTAPDGTSS